MATKISGKLEMLACSADLDEIFVVTTILHVLNALDIPKSTMSTIRRQRDPHTNKRYLRYMHTKIKFDEYN